MIVVTVVTTIIAPLILKFFIQRATKQNKIVGNVINEVKV